METPESNIKQVKCNLRKTFYDICNKLGNETSSLLFQKSLDSNHQKIALNILSIIFHFCFLINNKHL